MNRNEVQMYIQGHRSDPGLTGYKRRRRIERSGAPGHSAVCCFITKLNDLQEQILQY